MTTHLLTMVGDDAINDDIIELNIVPRIEIKRSAKLSLSGITANLKNVLADRTYEITVQDNIELDGVTVQPVPGVYNTSAELATALMDAKAVLGDATLGTQLEIVANSDVLTLLKFDYPTYTPDLDTWDNTGLPTTGSGTYTGTGADAASASQHQVGNNSFYWSSRLSVVDTDPAYTTFIGLAENGDPFNIVDQGLYIEVSTTGYEANIFGNVIPFDTAPPAPADNDVIEIERHGNSIISIVVTVGVAVYTATTTVNTDRYNQFFKNKNLRWTIVSDGNIEITNILVTDANNIGPATLTLTSISNSKFARHLGLTDLPLPATNTGTPAQIVGPDLMRGTFNPCISVILDTPGLASVQGQVQTISPLNIIRNIHNIDDLNTGIEFPNPIRLDMKAINGSLNRMAIRFVDARSITAGTPTPIKFVGNPVLSFVLEVE